MYRHFGDKVIKWSEFTFMASIVAKRKEIVLGDAFQCFKYSRKVSLSWFIYSHKDEELPISSRVSEHECWDMVMKNECLIRDDYKQMTCDGIQCKYDEQLTEYYPWIGKHEVTLFKCIMIKKSIIGENENTIVFNNHCKVKDLVCILADSIIVWKKQVLLDCPFDLIDNSPHLFMIRNGFIIDEERKLAFSFKESVKFCDNELLYTVEGLYLSIFSEFDKKLMLNNQVKIDQNTIVDLVLAENDFKFLHEYSVLNRLINLECRMMQIILKILENMHDKFIQIDDSNNNKVIFYAKNYNLYLPTCTEITEIKLREKTSKCYKDIPIYVFINDTSHNLFLTSNGIIKDTSEIIDCARSNQLMIIPNSKFAISKNGFEYKSIEIYDGLFSPYNFNSIKINTMIDHLSLITNGLSKEHSPNYIEIKENDGDWLVKKSDILITMNQTIDTFQSYYFNKLKKVIPLKEISLLIITCFSSIAVILVCYNRLSAWLRRKVDMSRKKNVLKKSLTSQKDNKVIIRRLSI